LITSNIIHRVFQLRVPSGATGTCFAIEHEGRQYVVTAAHVVDGEGPPYTFQILRNEWAQVDFALTGVDPAADTAVFSAPFQIAPTHPAPATQGDMVFGQRVFFLGFPYGIAIPDQGKINRTFPFPLVKAAHVAGFAKEGDRSVLLLDGLNNKGFSGGPVVFVPNEGRATNENPFRIGAVISGYRFANEPIYIGPEAQSATVRENTGITISYDIRHALNLIAANPNGFPV
jgi:S1-C subfamily serine protease